MNLINPGVKLLGRGSREANRTGQIPIVGSVLDGAFDIEADFTFANAAGRKKVAGDCHHFVVVAMMHVNYAIDAACRNSFAGDRPFTSNNRLFKTFTATVRLRVFPAAPEWEIHS